MRTIGFGVMMLWALFTASLAAAHPPYGLTADQFGNVYFSDLETVWRLSPDGGLSVFRPAVPERHVHALTLAPDGAIEGDQNHYDTRTQRFYTGLWRRNSAGTEHEIVPMSQDPPPGAGVWQDRSGHRYATQWVSNTDRRTLLLRRRPEGQSEVLFDETGGTARPVERSVESVGGVAFGGDGSLFFANRNVLRRVAADGAVTTVYKGGRKSSLRGLAVTRDGRVLAADMGEKRALALNPDGTNEVLYREKEGWLPTAIIQTGDRLLVLEANADPYELRDRVRLIEVRNGLGTVLAAPAHSQAGQATSSAKGLGPTVRMILLVSLVAAAAAFIPWILRSVCASRA